MVIAKVEPLTTTRAVRGPFDYRVPDGMELAVGEVIEVPFGRQRATAVVTALGAESELDPERLRTPTRSLGVVVPPELVELGLWLADDYCSTPARALGLVLPPGTGRTGRRVRERTRLTAEITGEGRKAIEDGTRLGARQRAALERLVDGPLAAIDLGRETGASHSTLRRLEHLGLIEVTDIEVRRAPAPGRQRSTRAATLTADQLHAGEQISAALADGGPGRFLLHGVTGSGKTEVYLAAAAEALAQDRGVIVLVPEIGLTPQTVSRFRERFGEVVAVLHSRLSDGERHDEWQRLRSGEARICVGPRSAVFAPVRRLGLLVVDEEHDSSYKQEGDPRYDARRVAERRCEWEGAVLVCGSATPRPESWTSLPRLDLPERVDGIPMPPVEVLDMRGRSGTAGPLHPSTVEALAEVRETGAKAIVLLNRRGWSAYVRCGVCGSALGCPNCDVSLVLHRASGSVSCHHCGHRAQQPDACPDCGSASLSRAVAGTERVEHDLESLLSPLPIFRLDADTAAGSGSIESILDAFADAPAGVLLGTQMVAKGHDFPEVVLSVVIDADQTLRFPDFRAEERTFAMVAQLAGRSGRGPAGGRVLVQTTSPNALCIEAAAAHDAAAFLEVEIERRRLLRYPPFSTLIRIQCASADVGAVERTGELIAALVRLELPEGTQVMGPAPLFRIKGRARRAIEIKAENRPAAIAAVRDAIENVASDRRARGVALAVDVDPQ